MSFSMLMCCAVDIWSRSSFWVTQRRLPQCWCQQNNWSCTEISPFTDCNKTHFCCKFWIYLLDIKPFYWFKWYKWPKMAFKMSQEFPTASLNITKDFHILHSTYVYICYSILKQKHTTGSLMHTHDQQQLQTATTTNKKQLGTSLMVISLAQMLLSCVKFRSLWLFES